MALESQEVNLNPCQFDNSLNIHDLKNNNDGLITFNKDFVKDIIILSKEKLFLEDERLN